MYMWRLSDVAPRLLYAFPNQRAQITAKPSGQPPNLRANNDTELHKPESYLCRNHDGKKSPGRKHSSHKKPEIIGTDRAMYRCFL